MPWPEIANACRRLAHGLQNEPVRQCRLSCEPRKPFVIHVAELLGIAERLIVAARMRGRVVRRWRVCAIRSADLDGAGQVGTEEPNQIELAIRVNAAARCEVSQPSASATL